MGGLLIGIAFGVGHNGMALYDHANPPPFGVLQISTTRNVHDNGFTGWFMGGLHYQIEHHLFPTMPRNNLAEAAVRVKALCKKHDVPYHATGLIEGNIESWRHWTTSLRAWRASLPCSCNARSAG